MNVQKLKKILYGIVPVILFGFVTGYILWYKTLEYPPHRYGLDFDGSVWISTGKETPHGYFVKEIFVPGDAADAWIAVAATDSVDLFVNGVGVGSDTFVSLNVSAIHDITGRLRKGKNVVAAYVRRSSYPGGSKLLLKGVHTDLSGREHVFASDGTWMVSSVEETQGGGDIPWYSEKFDHSGWRRAAAEGNSASFPVYTSQVAPYLLGKTLSGYWIWHPEQNVRSSYFLKSFTVDLPAKDGFIGIAGCSNYDLAVNGVSVATRMIFDKTLHIYNITSLLRRGENVIGIGVRSPDASPGLFVEGYIDGGNSKIALKSDETWRTVSNITAETGSPRVETGDWKVPVLLAKYPSEPWGILSKDVKSINLPLTFTGKRFLDFTIFMLTVIALVLCIWLATAFLYSKNKNIELEESLLLDGLLHALPLLFLLFIYLLKFDVRYDPSFPFQYKFVFAAFVILFLSRTFSFVIPAKDWSLKFLEKENGRLSGLLVLFLLACLMTAGFLIRVHELDYVSLSHDEIGMVQYTQGLLAKGTAVKEVGSLTKTLTTYELLPYSVSIPVILFGLNDFVARFHSVFWGTLEILLLYLLGKTLFSRVVGLAAAVIYTFHPWCIIWSQNLFYPQLTQVMTTLTILFFYKAIDLTPMNRKYLYLTAISFSLMYLSWEGSGFLLAAMALAILIHKGSDLSWLKNKHLWASFAIVFLTVFIQMSRRILYQDAYLIVAGKISDIGLPALFFLDPMYNPYFYVDMFFFTENNWIFTIVLVAGIFLIFKSRPLRYLYVMLLSLIFFMTNFLQVASNRYVYHVEPILILIASAVGLSYINALRSLFKDKTVVVRSSAFLSAVTAFLILFTTSNDIFLKLYLLSKNPFDPPNLIRQNVYWNDYKSTMSYIAENSRKGDLIFALMPHTLQYYAGIKGDYSLMTLFGKTMVYDMSGEPGFIEKYMGNPVITSFDEFKRRVAGFNRIWFVSAPNRALLAANDAETTDYIRKNFKVCYESYNSKVYLWEK